MTMFTWMEKGHCRDEDPVLFFPTNGNVSTAVILCCSRCPVRDECYVHALRHEDYGIWAATSEQDRRRLRKAAGIKFQRLEWSPSYKNERPSERCGTPAGYKRHRRAGQEACELCLMANADQTKADKLRRRTMNAG